MNPTLFYTYHATPYTSITNHLTQVPETQQVHLHSWRICLVRIPQGTSTKLHYMQTNNYVIILSTTIVGIPNTRFAKRHFIP
jgi:hypothetical protein